MTRRTVVPPANRFRTPHDDAPFADGGRHVAGPALRLGHGFASARGTARTVTVADAAQLLGISRSLAYLCVHRGELPAVRLGGRIVVPTAAIDELLKLRTALSASHIVEQR